MPIICFDFCTALVPESTEGWLKSQIYRKATLNSTCLKNNLFKLKRNLNLIVANQLFVEHNYRFIYCEVPKVGCSNWKRIILLLKMNLSRDTSEIKHDYIHTSRLLKRLSSYPTDKQKELLNSYTKVMFTRHPLEWLVSAYRDKLLHSETYYSITVANQIRGRFKKKLNSTEKVSFQEFVDFTVERKPDTLDIHWKPMFLLCDPCNVQYDILGKYETLGQDSEHVLKSIRAPEGIHFPDIKRYSSENQTNDKITMEYLRKLNSEQIQKIKKLYQMDFSLFDYSLTFGN
ncbi:PREDICTED: carbohydrate sulfotransferase 8-like [Crocodylus porosus]|nr:PREDICTED: carbohydrate sulfotransferase 8-like [Crocodylus porosus]